VAIACRHAAGIVLAGSDNRRAVAALMPDPASMQAGTATAYEDGHGVFSAARDRVSRRMVASPDSPSSGGPRTEPSRGGFAMNRKLKGCVLALAAMVAPGIALAQDLSVSQLSHMTGVRERNIKMVFGARSAFPEYKTGGYDQARKQIVAAIGRERFDDITAGRVVLVDDTRVATR